MTTQDEVAALDAQINDAETLNYQTATRLRELREKRAELAKKCSLVGPYDHNLDFVEVDDKGNHVYSTLFVREIRLVAIRPPPRTSFAFPMARGEEQEPEFYIRQPARATKQHFELILKELRDRLVELVP